MSLELAPGKDVSLKNGLGRSEVRFSLGHFVINIFVFNKILTTCSTFLDQLLLFWTTRVSSLILSGQMRFDQPRFDQSSWPPFMLVKMCACLCTSKTSSKRKGICSKKSIQKNLRLNDFEFAKRQTKNWIVLWLRVSDAWFKFQYHFPTHCAKCIRCINKKLF